MTLFAKQSNDSSLYGRKKEKMRVSPLLPNEERTCVNCMAPAMGVLELGNLRIQVCEECVQPEDSIVHTFSKPEPITQEETP